MTVLVIQSLKTIGKSGVTEEDRSELFQNTADKMKLQDAIVEKDFWVCYSIPTYR